MTGAGRAPSPRAGGGGFEVTGAGGVTTLWIDRPAKRNALTRAMWEALPGLLREIADDAATEVLIVAGRGGHFSAGSDIGELPEDLETFWRVNSAAEHALASFPRPTIAAVEGSCVGGGCELAVACDLRVAAPGARFGITAAKVGALYPPGPTERFAALVGPGTARRLLLTGELIGAREALDLGLVQYLADDPRDAAGRLADTLRRGSALSQAHTKRVLLGAAPDGDGEGAPVSANPTAAAHATAQSPAVRPSAAGRPSAELAAAAARELAEGKAAFAAKRPPRFPA